MLANLMRDWYQPRLTWRTFLLLPWSWLFALIIFVRRKLYQWQLLKSQRLSVPVIVVGNIVIGGTGKTPFVIWLVTLLKRHGLRPGIVSKGVGGKRHRHPHWVSAADVAHEIGDEAVLLYQRTQCPMVIGVDRVQAAKKLIAESQCDIVISDDGLQHYRLHRDFEIVMVDGERQHGNGCLLPAGPLREPISRLSASQLVIQHGGVYQPYSMHLAALSLSSLNKQQPMLLNEWQNKKVHAVAAIGHPERFFKQLQQAGLEIIPHAFADHYTYEAKDFEFNDDLPIIMTEKDAVKCYNIADHRFWYLSVDAMVSAPAEQVIKNKFIQNGVMHHVETNHYSCVDV